MHTPAAQPPMPERPPSPSPLAGTLGTLPRRHLYRLYELPDPRGPRVLLVINDRLTDHGPDGAVLLTHTYDKTLTGRPRRLFWRAMRTPDPSLDPTGYARRLWWTQETIDLPLILAMEGRGLITEWPHDAAPGPLLGPSR